MRRRGLIAVVVSLAAAPALAQPTSTTGAVTGTVRDADGSAVIGATVVATSAALQGTRGAISDGGGDYDIASLPPGLYQIEVYYGSGHWSRGNVVVAIGQVVRVNIAVDTAAAAGETIEIEGVAPIVDQSSTKTGIVVDEDYTRRIPTGTTFHQVLGAGAGVQADALGASYGGATSLENMFVVEGLNTNEVLFGSAGPELGGRFTTSLPNEFLRQTEIITGGYGPEHRSSTGGVIAVATKSGGNHVHGSVFGYWQPGQLSPAPRRLAREGSSLVERHELDYLASIGAEVGGPIVADRLWFHAGLNPVFGTSRLLRSVHRFVDRDNDGEPDVDPATGFSRTEQLSERALDETIRQLYFHGKLTAAAAADHRGSLTVLGSPSTTTEVAADGALARETSGTGAVDAIARWGSAFRDGRTRIDVTAGVHRELVDLDVDPEAFRDNRVVFAVTRPLTDYAGFEAGGVPGGCYDLPGSDPYPEITNCPIRSYRIGSPRDRVDAAPRRLAVGVDASERLELAGAHLLEAGLDLEANAIETSEVYAGDGKLIVYQPGVALVFEHHQLRADGEMPCGPDVDGDGVGDARCTDFGDAVSVTARTRDIGIYAGDSWSIRPNLTINAGLRWDRHDSRVGDNLAGLDDPGGGRFPDTAFTLDDMFAPRIGVVYDWTREGRSKAFAHWGRYYQAMPARLASFQDGVSTRLSFVIPSLDIDGDGAAGCTPPEAITAPNRVQCDTGDAVQALTFGGGVTQTVPDLKSSYSDELVAGVEYELIAGLKVSAAYIRKELGRVLEDVSTDGGNTFVLANPGEGVDPAAIDALRADAAAARAAGDEARASRLESEADSLDGVAVFDRGSRRYDALQLSATRRFAGRFMAVASYTVSRLEGNFPGLFNPDTGQVTPNANAQFDLPELMANRYGRLPHDRPHLLNLDGYVYHAIDGVGHLVAGVGLRVASGTPVDVLGAHVLYGADESYLLPRGAGGRTDRLWTVDTRLTFGRTLDRERGIGLEVFVDLFNLFNRETEVAVDERYTRDSANPIVGGDRRDLEHAKAIDLATGLPGGRVVEPNPNFGNATAALDPFAARFGARLSF